MRPALLRRATASEDARAACPIHSRFPAGNASLPGRQLSPHVFFASVARGGGLHRCGGADAPPSSHLTMPAPRGQVANRSPDSPPAAPRCSAGRSRPTYSLRPSPVVVVGADAAALLRRASASEDAGDACPIRKLSPDVSPATPCCPVGRSRPTCCLCVCLWFLSPPRNLIWKSFTSCHSTCGIRANYEQHTNT